MEYHYFMESHSFGKAVFSSWTRALDFSPCSPSCVYLHILYVGFVLYFGLSCHIQESSRVTPDSVQGLSVLALYSDPNSVGDGNNDFSCKDNEGSSWEPWPLHHLGCTPTSESNPVAKLMAIHGLSDMILPSLDIGWWTQHDSYGLCEWKRSSWGGK